MPQKLAAAYKSNGTLLVTETTVSVCFNTSPKEDGQKGDLKRDGGRP